MTEKTFPDMKPFYVREMEELVLCEGLPTFREELVKLAQATLAQLDDERHWHRRAFLKVRLAMCLEKIAGN